MRLVDKIQTQLVDTQSVLFAFDLSAQRAALDLAREAVRELQQLHPERRTSNVYGEWLSPKNAHELSPKLQPLCQLVTTLCGQIWHDVFGQGGEHAADEFYVWQSWAVDYGQGGYAESHNHFPAFFAAVVYLEADATSAPIVFGHNAARPSLPNTLYIFPGALQHAVPHNTGRRVVVAMNILKKNPA
ncbi:hypothetical protein [Roseateles sp. BYS87W]|uniref:hypothetical protein n=1 Tax=Pelomonas baiyunensis TaxID=3299026 RepID=UPI0037488A3F